MTSYQTGLNPNFLEPKESLNEMGSNIFNVNNELNQSRDLEAQYDQKIGGNFEQKKSKYSLFPDQIHGTQQQALKKEPQSKNLNINSNKNVKNTDNLEYEIQIFDHFCRKKNIKLSGLKRK